MENAKAYTILRTFSKSELAGFRRFITSDFINKSKNIVELYDLVRKYHPDFNSRALQPAALHRKIFHKNAKSTKSVNNLFTKLVRLSEHFLQYQAFIVDTQSAERYLLLQFDKRRLENLFLHRMERAMSAAEKLAKNDSLNLQNILGLRIIEMNHYFNYLFPTKHRLFNEKIAGTFDSLMDSSYLRILRGICKFSVTRYWTVFDENLLEKINLVRKYISGLTEFVSLPLAKIFMAFSDVFDFGTPAKYFQLKHLLLENEEVIGKEDFGVLLVALLYYCDFVNLLNNHCFDNEIIEIVNKMQEGKPWLTFGGIHEDIFINIISAGLRLDKQAWSEKMAEDNIDKVIPERRSDTLRFCRANIAYHKSLKLKDEKIEMMGKALEFLSHYKANDYYGRISSYCLNMKLSFELGNIEQLLYLGDNLEHFLKERRDTIPAPLFESHHSFNRLCCKLGRLQYSQSMIQINELANEIENSLLCANKYWLKEQIRTLIVYKFIT